MTKYLLDTHILLWSLMDPSALTAEVTAVLDNLNNESWISPISTWEILSLTDKGRIELDEHPVRWMNSVLDTLPLREATFNHEVAIQSRIIQLPHQDPADRCIAGTALVYDLTLMTADRTLIQGAKGISALPNL